jgi:hypothetical protein
MAIIIITSCVPFLLIRSPTTSTLQHRGPCTCSFTHNNQPRKTKYLCRNLEHCPALNSIFVDW